MRLRRLALKGITRFDQTEVDFAALGEGLVAIAGANGAGKTTILEAPFAALYGEFPTRQGSLYGVTHGKDAQLELEFDNGQPYRALVAVDADHQRTEAYLYNGSGEPITNGKVREFYAEIERRFGSARLMLSAALSCQTKRGSFLDLSKAERKDLLSEILDTGGLQRLAESARAKAKAGELALERLRGQLAEAESELQRLTGSGPTEDLAAEQTRLEAAIATAQADLESARARHADLQTRHALAMEAEKQRTAKQQEIAALDRDTTSLLDKLKTIPAEQERGRERAAAAIAAAQELAVRLPEYQAAADALPAARVGRATAQSSVTNREHAVREAREALLEQTRATGKGATVRTRMAVAQRQAGLLGEVPCAVAGAWVRAEAIDAVIAAGSPGPQTGFAHDLSGTCPLLADARTAKDAITGLEAEVADIEALEAALPQFQHDVDQAEATVKADRELLAAAQAEVERLEPLAARVAGAQAAQVRAAEIGQQLEDALLTLAKREQDYREHMAGIEAKRAAVMAGLEGMAHANTGALKSEMTACADEVYRIDRDIETDRLHLRSIEAAIARAEVEAQHRAELEERAAQTGQQAAALEADLGDWVTLERALGRDGIQALMIDAAGPELSRLTNDLLHSSFTDRFEVAFVTQAPKADGKGAKEIFDLKVVDHERGREGSVDSLSGGEKVVISEAVSLALAIFVGKSSGRRYQTLFRDETAGALDPENAHKYIAMLRRARELAGAHQILFICQQPELWSQADSVLWLENGRIEVRQ